MAVFMASNGVTVRFKVRGAPTSYFMVAEQSQPEHELSVTDDGVMRMSCDAPVPAEFRKAYWESVIDEIARYAEWRSERVYLLPEEESNIRNVRDGLRWKLAMAAKNLD